MRQYFGIAILSITSMGLALGGNLDNPQRKTLTPTPVTNFPVLQKADAEELRQELARVPEIALGQAGTDRLLKLAELQRKQQSMYFGPVVLVPEEPEWAGLPFILGPESLLAKEPTEKMHAMSRELRTTVQACTPNGAVDPRPDPEMLFDRLLTSKSRDQWQSPESVPCIQQMLQSESTDIRLMSTALLKGIDARQATQMLARWAIFDLSAEVRSAATEALRKRPDAEYMPTLLGAFRYPWAPAAEHAAEALVALQRREAVPHLVALLKKPDPDRPFVIGQEKRPIVVQREMVRVNHLSNCVMCHAPSFERTDLVRGAVPARDKAIPSAITPQYYDNGEKFVRADITYLRQDFSVVQPLGNAGLWPTQQRFDYLVRLKRVSDTALTTDAPTETTRYQKAIIFALDQLKGRGERRSPADWIKAFPDVPMLPEQDAPAESSQYLALWSRPQATVEAAWNELGARYLLMNEREQLALRQTLIRKHGEPYTLELLRTQLNLLMRTSNVAQREQIRLVLQRLDNRSTLSPSLTNDPPVVTAPEKMKNSLSTGTVAQRVAAIRKMGVEKKLGGAAISDITGALSDQSVEVRIAIAELIDQLKLDNHVLMSQYRLGFADASGLVHYYMIRSASRHKEVSPSLSVMLYELLMREHDDLTPTQAAEVRQLALTLLQRMGSKAKDLHSPILNTFADKDTNRDTLIMVAKLFVELGPVPEELNADMVALLPRSDLRLIMLSRLRVAGPGVAFDLLPLLRHEDAEVRLAVVKLLGELGNRDRKITLALAERKRNESNLRVQLAAIDAFATLDSPK